MREFLIGIAIFGLLIGCNNNQTNKDAAVAGNVIEKDVLVENELLNIRDSLEVIDGLGPVIEREYEGLISTKDTPGIQYDLTLINQENSQDGVFELTKTFLSSENGKNRTVHFEGKRHTLQGSANDKNATVYVLNPLNGGETHYYLVEGDNLTLLDHDLKKYTHPWDNSNHTLMRKK